MPSIPQSLLWISLVVLWLFVLVPMLVNKREAVRRTSDVALSTRVLTGANRLRGRSGPAAGHRSDPDWQDVGDESMIEDGVEVGVPNDDTTERASTGVFAAVDADRQTAFDFGDGASEEAHTASGRNVGEAEQRQGAAAGSTQPPADAEFEAGDATADVVATSVAEVNENVPADEAGVKIHGEEDEDASVTEHRDADCADHVADVHRDPAVPITPRQARCDVRAAAVSARKYEFRKRALLVMTVALFGATLVAFTVAPGAWWLSAASAAAMVFYLGYLRRQTRIEEQVRARRAERAERGRTRSSVPPTPDLGAAPDRLRRPGLAVLEIDDEDPAFEHLEYAATAPGRASRNDDLPRASGQ